MESEVAQRSVATDAALRRTALGIDSFEESVAGSEFEGDESEYQKQNPLQSLNRGLVSESVQVNPISDRSSGSMGEPRLPKIKLNASPGGGSFEREDLQAANEAAAAAMTEKKA